MKTSRPPHPTPEHKTRWLLTPAKPHSCFLSGGRDRKQFFFFFHLERESEIKSRPACKSKLLVTYRFNQRKRKSAKNNTCSCGSSPVAEIILCQMAPKVSSSASAKGPNYRRGPGGYGEKKDFKTLGISNGWGLHWGSGRVQNAITD